MCTPACELRAYTSRAALQGEEGGEILEGDLATCSVHLSLERLSATGVLLQPPAQAAPRIRR